jgi:hypothetical protein
MYAGFITPKRVVKRAGIHQRFDMAAYHLIEPYLPTEPESFPTLKEVLHFEGYNGPDGLNTKSGLKPKGIKPKDDSNPNHEYDPITDTGEIPGLIAGHYAGLVESLKSHDTIRSAFEAAWLAHFVGDGLTPAHHWPLEERIAEAASKASDEVKGGDVSKYMAFIQRNWAIWGAKGHMTTHMNFELGIAFALLLFPIRPEFDPAELTRASTLGPVEYFKAEARSVAALDLYNRFYKEGWTADIAATVKNQLAPQAARTIGIIWLIALLESGRQLAVQAQSATTAATESATSV